MHSKPCPPHQPSASCTSHLSPPLHVSSTSPPACAICNACAENAVSLPADPLHCSTTLVAARPPHAATCYGSPMPTTRLLVPLLLLITGCAMPPKVLLSGTGILTERSSDATAGTATIHVINPNDHAIKLVEFDYTAQIPGSGSWRGRHAGGMVLAAGFDRTAELPIVLPASATPGSQVHISGSLHYLDTSTIAETLAEWGYRPTTSFSGKATIQAASVPVEASAETH